MSRSTCAKPFARLRMTSTSYVSASALHSIHHSIQHLSQGYKASIYAVHCRKKSFFSS